MISSFCLTTNAIKMGFPFEESIRSWLAVSDELVVVDGGSTDGTIEAIQKISDKIKIINDEDSRWEKDWTYWRMNHNFNRGFEACHGDIILKFDADRVLHEGDNGLLIQQAGEMFKNNYLVMKISRYGIPRVDCTNKGKHHVLATNIALAREMGLEVKFGLDLERCGFHNNFVVVKEKKYNLYLGDAIGEFGEIIDSEIREFNYGYCFCTKSQAVDNRWRHENAVQKQQKMMGMGGRYFSKKTIREQLENCFDEKGLLNHIRLRLEDHPRIMQEKVKNINKNMRGYNLWGKLSPPVL